MSVTALTTGATGGPHPAAAAVQRESDVLSLSSSTTSAGALSAETPHRRESSHLPGGANASGAPPPLTTVDALHLLAMYLSAIMHDYDHRSVMIMMTGQ